MITFDVLTLKALITEEKEFITGARINKIRQPNRREFIFTLRNNGISRDFYVNITPQMYHVCFMSKENFEKRHIEIPQKPPMFCMQLRKYLENSRISKVNQPENERILEFYIETYSETGDKIYLCLAFELMGKHSNVILYNCDTQIIIGCAHNVGSEKSREREIYGGIPYIYPPKQISMSKTWKSLIEENNSSDNINDLIDTYYADFIALEKFKNIKGNYYSIICQKLKKINKSLNQMEQKMQTRSDSDKYRLYGDLLMANLYALKDYTDKVTVFDYENNKEITLELNPLKTIKENATNFYKLYNKGKTTQTKLTELIEISKEKQINLEQILYSLDACESFTELDEIIPEIDTAKPIAKKSKQPPEITKIELPDGSRIFIGKNNRQNDYIVSKLADEDDLWFHIKGCAGSHILLKSQTPTDEMILRCAQYAKEFSQAKTEAKAGVIYTKRKYLRKPPAAALGYVTYRNEQEIVV